MKVKDLIATLNQLPAENDIAIEIDGRIWAEMDGPEFREIKVRESNPPGLTILSPK